MVMQFSPRFAITFIDVLFIQQKNSSPEIVEREGPRCMDDGWAGDIPILSGRIWKLAKKYFFDQN
jgi:hypothetical protein